MARTKKELERFSNNLQKLSDSLDDITNNVDDINNQFEGYNNQINDIKDNVKTLENELKEFMHEVKITPIIEKAKNDIIKDKEELNKKYSKHNKIRERLINLVNNPNNKEYLLTNDEINDLIIEDYYLSYILLYVNDLFNNKKTANKRIDFALKLDKEKTSLLLILINIKLNNNNDALAWLNYYLDLINPLSTNDYIVKLIKYIKDDKELINKVYDKINGWLTIIDKDEDTMNEINNNLSSYINIRKINDEDYPYLYNYVNEFDDVLDELYISNIYSDFYIKINDSINLKDNSYDLFNDLVYTGLTYENKLKMNIIENEYIINNNGKSKKFTQIENKNIISIFLLSLSSKKYDKSTKEILLYYLKNYLLKHLNNYEEAINTDEINIRLSNWNGKTSNGSNEAELINNLNESIKKHYNDENEKLTIINFKTIYSFAFIFIGIILSIFFTVIGICMVIVGTLMAIYFVYLTYSQKKTNEELCNQDIIELDDELYNTLAEIVDIKLEIFNNLNNKKLLLDYINNINLE